MSNLKDKKLGGLFGLLIGDALGVPYEFYESKDLPSFKEIEFEPPKNFQKTYRRVKAGTWSDDGAQALCLLDSLIQCNTLDVNDFSKKLIKWYDNGYWAVDNYVFDCGIQTADAIIALENGVSPLKSGFIRPDGKGNGSLMRVLPLVIWHEGSDEELVEFAHTQSIVTHGHICNQICCALYCLWGRSLLNNQNPTNAYHLAVNKLLEIYKTKKEYIDELEFSIRPLDDIKSNGSGYVVDSLRACNLLKKSNSYEEVVKNAVLLGKDTDTNAAIVGGLAGLFYGYESIPKRWINNLHESDKVNELISKIL